MPNFSIAEALGVGFGLIGRRPLAVLAWGLVPSVVVVALFLIFGASVFAIVAQAASFGDDRTAALQAIAPALGGILLFVLLAILASWVLGAVLYGAAFRAVLHPEQSSFAYLRFGTEELWLMAVIFVLGLIYAGIGLVFAIPQGIIGISLIGGPVSVRATADLVLTLLRLAVTFWVWLRLSLALPMTFANRRFQLFESWALTRGHTISLLGFAVAAFLIVIVVDCVAVAVGVGGGIGLAGGAFAAARANPQAFFANAQGAIASFAGAIVLWSALLVIISSVSTAIVRAPFAYIYRRLAGADVARTFT